MFNCALCTKTFKTSTNFNHHMVSHTKEKPHKCLKCPAAFGLKGTLKQHIKVVHDGIREIKKKNSHCTLCSFQGSSKGILQAHLRKHSSELPFSCEIPSCSYKTKYKDCLKRHVFAVHSDERPHECPTDGCSYKAKNMSNLKAHLKIHSNARPFACKIPGCKFTCKRNYLKRHNFAVHSDGELLKCPNCDFQTKYRANFKTHQYTHAKVKRFQCPASSCGFGSSKKCTVELHFDSKHRKKDIKCTVLGCSRRFGSINLLKIHLRVHERQILKCPAASCNFSARRKCSLRKHITRTHSDSSLALIGMPRKFGAEVSHTAGGVDILLCNLPNCGYQTKFPHQYDRHRETHKEKEKRKHVCTFCFYRCSHLNELQRHIQRHTGEKPYSCSLCEYKAVVSSELRYHAKKIHHTHVVPRGKEEEKRNCHTCNITLSCHTEFMLHSMTHLRPVVMLERLRVHMD